MRVETSNRGFDMQRMTWEQICQSDDLRGRWIAMDECQYDEATGRATEGLVVDSDDDLAELCARIRESERTNCSILFAGDEHSAYRGALPRIAFN
jgi:hypothetical protein